MQELAEKTRQSFRASLKGTDAWLWPNNVYVSAKVIAGAVWEGFSFLDYIKRQIFISSADDEYLDEHGKDWGLPRHPATLAKGLVDIMAPPGTIIPAGTVLRRSDGYQYQINADINTQNGHVSAPVTAFEAGKNGNAFPGMMLDAPAPITGAQVAVTGIGGGTDRENKLAYKSRLLERKRLVPHAGAPGDFVRWTREVSGVTRVFVERIAFGRGTVGIWFLMDDTYPNGIPLGSDRQRVLAYLHDIAPSGCDPIVVLPVPSVVNITIEQLGTDNLNVREAIGEELKDFFLRESRPGTNNQPFTLYHSRLSEAISQAAGEQHHRLVTPALDMVFTDSQMPVLGSITYV